MEKHQRIEFAIDLAKRAGALAMAYYAKLDQLAVHSKGHQDLVSEADREVELFIRREIAVLYPEDGIVGEEYLPVEGRSGMIWVIDPIDGTSNFVRGIPQWCVIIACCHQSETEIAVIYAPVSGETYHAQKGGGAFMDGKAISVSAARGAGEGIIGIDYSVTRDTRHIVPVITEILASGAAFFRTGSGGLMLAYVSSGRLLGYVEEHMNAWDCLAGLLLIEEAGGRILPLDRDSVLAAGTAVVATCPGIYQVLYDICSTPFSLGR